MSSWRIGLLLSLLTLGCGGAAEDGGDPVDGLDEAGTTDAGVGEAASSADAADVGSESGESGSDFGPAAPKCPTPPIADTVLADRKACKFGKGDRVVETLGITKAVRATIPLAHLIIVMNENRSFDHYFGHLDDEGQPEAEGLPAGVSNKDAAGVAVKPFHLSSTCLERDATHGWAAYHDKWNSGKMDGYVTESAVGGSNGHFAMGYYNKSDLPFYNFLAKTWAIGDRNFASVIGPTWPNRDYLYAATSDGVRNTDERVIDVRTIFDAMNDAKVSWGIFGDGGSRAHCVGVTSANPHHHDLANFFDAAASGDLPAVSFLDPTGSQDEHPAGNVQGGEAWARRIYEAVRKSPAWPKTALIYTYDEGGGLYDHVPPPKACLPSAGATGFDRLGPRVPLLVVSPYARPHHVSHVTHDHTSITRLIELLHDLPALTGRDANADALLDMFDFACPTMLDAPVAPASGKGGCP